MCVFNAGHLQTSLFFSWCTEGPFFPRLDPSSIQTKDMCKSSVDIWHARWFRCTTISIGMISIGAKPSAEVRRPNEPTIRCIETGWSSTHGAERMTMESIQKQWLRCFRGPFFNVQNSLFYLLPVFADSSNFTTMHVHYHIIKDHTHSSLKTYT